MEAKETILELSSHEVETYVEEFTKIRLMYQSALREVGTKLEILNDEFSSLRQDNPIEHIKSRIKTPASMLKKLARKGLPPSVESARRNLNDIAGIRVICSFVDDIYMVADTLIRQNDVTLVKRTDYIKNPKPNGYRSPHLVVEIPVFFSNGMERVRVEVQIRTVAMDFWASLEHKLRYKHEGRVLAGVSEDLLYCAEQISLLDEKMMKINQRIMEADGRETA